MKDIVFLALALCAGLAFFVVVLKKFGSDCIP
jgi:hypothetical protein